MLLCTIKKKINNCPIFNLQNGKLLSSLRSHSLWGLKNSCEKWFEITLRILGFIAYVRSRCLDEMFRHRGRILRITPVVVKCGSVTHLCLVAAAGLVQLPDVVLLHPPPGVLRVPVRGSLYLPAYVLARAAKYERLPARVHPQEGGYIVHPGP